MLRVRVLASIALLIVGCNRAPETRQYELTGQILAVAPERREVTIQHEDIKGFMPGMTMSFPVEDGALLEGKQPGDLVTATLVVGEVRVHLSTIVKTGHRPVETSTAPGLRTGDPVADAALVDETGAPRTLTSLRGHRVALTFMYTRCPIPDFCPLMNRHFAALQDAVRSKRELADVRLLTITLDPAFDTPRVLKAHARLFKAEPSVWSFLTGEPAEVKRFAEQFGMYQEADPKDPSQITHSLRTAVIGHDGRLLANRSGNDWTPADLLADLTAAPAPAN